MTFRIREVGVLVCSFAVLLIAVLPACAFAKSAVQKSRDGTTMLVSKDVGSERWAISYDVQNDTVVGNIFFPGTGDAGFVWCEQVRTDGSSDPRLIQRTFACYGASPCSSEPCSESQWNFISEVTLPGEFFLPPGGSEPIPTSTPVAVATKTPTPANTPDSLADLLGTWTFETTIGGTVFFDHYDFDRVETIEGTRVIVGTDLDDGGPILAARTSDLSDEPFPYTFAMLDPGISICDFFVFDKTGQHRVAGADVLTDRSGGRCTSFLTGNLNPMVGTRVGTSAASASHPHSSEVAISREARVVIEDESQASVADAGELREVSTAASRLMALFGRLSP